MAQPLGPRCLKHGDIMVPVPPGGTYGCLKCAAETVAWLSRLLGPSFRMIRGAQA